MSLTLNMVGGGGSLKATDALLRVQAPAGSTVTISKGTTTKTDLGHENADDHTRYDYYFIIHQSQFDSVNPWTVTLTPNDAGLSKTVIIDSADEYDVNLYYKFIYNQGVISSDVGSLVAGYNSGVACTRTANADNYYMKGVGNNDMGSNGSTVGNNSINITQYSKIGTVFSAFTRTSDGIAIVGAATGKTSSLSTRYAGTPTPNEPVFVDISALSGNYYIGFGGGGSVRATWEFNIIKLWLEE